MKPKNVKSFNRTLLAASIGMIGIAAPVTTWADDAEMRRLTQPVSEVEVGIVNVSEGSYKFGDYTGLRDNKAYGNANVSVIRRGEADATYLEIEGRDLGLDSRNLSVEGGEQGNYGLRFSYGELPKYITGDFYSPYSGMGSSRLVAPAGWLGTIDRTPGGAINPPIAATNLTTAMMTQLGASMKPYDIETKRKDLSLGFSKMLPAGWDIDFDYKHKKKEGDKLRAAPVQNSTGGTRFTVLVPDPIDYTDDQFSVIARYVDEKLQLQFGYQLSVFKNHANALVFDNLAYNPLSVPPGSNNGGASPTGQLGTMPDNKAHQISASANYRFSKDTSLSGSVSIGRMTQDEKFLPYTSLNQAGLTALPVNSLDADVDTKHFDIKLVSKLTKTIKLTAGYRYDDRDNNTDVYQFRYQTGDNSRLANYADNPNQSTRRWNMPMDKNKQVLYGDLDFHLAKGTTLKVGYDYDRIDHNYEPTDGDSEQTYKAEIKHQFNAMASGGLAYAHSKRDAERYDGGLALQDTYNSVYLASLCVIPNTFNYKGVMTACTGAASATGATTPWLDTPALRKYFLTDRKRDKLRAFANVTPIENFDLQFMGHYFDDEYPDANDGYGLTKAKGTSFSIDGNLKATDQITGTFFLAYDQYKTDQNGHNGSTNNLERQNNAANFQNLKFGEVSIDDSSWAAGLGVRFTPGGQYEWGGDYNYVKTNTDIGFHNLGTDLVNTVKPVPDGKTKRHRLDLFGKYTIDKEWAVRANYTYERFTSDDWAWDGQTQDRSTSFILPGITSPNYNVHMVGVMVSYKFQ